MVYKAPCLEQMSHIRRFGLLQEKKRLFSSKMLPITVTLLLIATQDSVLGQDYFVRGSRANDAPKNFENFFLKASKSVPRIGRRDFDLDAKYYADSTGFYRPNGQYPNVFKKFDDKAKDNQMSFEDFFRKSLKSVPRIGRRDNIMGTKYYEDSSGFYRPRLSKKYGADLNDLAWDDLADKIEYYPEFLISPHLLAQAGLVDYNGDQESVHKRTEQAKTSAALNKELPECRMQAEV